MMIILNTFSQETSMSNDEKNLTPPSTSPSPPLKCFDDDDAPPMTTITNMAVKTYFGRRGGQKKKLKVKNKKKNLRENAGQEKSRKRKTKVGGLKKSHMKKTFRMCPLPSFVDLGECTTPPERS